MDEEKFSWPSQIHNCIKRYDKESGKLDRINLSEHFIKIALMPVQYHIIVAVTCYKKVCCHEC